MSESEEKPVSIDRIIPILRDGIIFCIQSQDFAEKHGDKSYELARAYFKMKSHFERLVTGEDTITEEGLKSLESIIESVKKSAEKGEDFSA